MDIINEIGKYLFCAVILGATVFTCYGMIRYGGIAGKFEMKGFGEEDEPSEKE